MGRRASERIPPYVAYRTFINFLEGLRSRGLPARIDRSVMSHKSGTIQSQLLLALRYLGLVKPSGQPTVKLQKLVQSEGAARKTLLREILRSSYDIVFDGDFGLETATTHQAEELFQQTGATGETVRRSIAFFLAAARQSGIQVSPYIQPHGRRKSTSKKREGRDQISPPSEDAPARAGGRRIQLRSGGSVSLELSADVFDLDEKDREFVFDLIDRMKQYAG